MSGGAGVAGQAVESAQLASDEALEFIRALVGAWDCCATCAGGVLLRYKVRPHLTGGGSDV